jgi:hypothetical protein
VNPYSLSHLSDRTLLRDLVAHLANERASTATVLAHIAEVDARRLYVPAAYPSMHAYCVGELHLSEDAAAKRIQVARVARELPAVFEALAQGRVHLSGLVLLAPHLTPESVEELLAAATHRSKSEIERLLAERSPQPDVPALVMAVSPAFSRSSPDQHAPGHVDPPLARAEELAPGQADATGARSRVKPLSPQRYALQFTIGQSAHDKLRHVQELLSHQLPSGDIAEIFERALDVLTSKLEKRKFAATDRPRKGASCSRAGSRYIPAAVRRAVSKRDGGQCTFVSASGKRCSARKFLEFDHVDPVARGGRASVSGIRLRCRAHNQFEAGRTFGAGFMEGKRRAASEAQAGGREAPGTTEAPAARARVADAGRENTQTEARAANEAQAAAAEVQALAEARAKALEVIPWPKRLGFRADEAREAAGSCESIADAPIEDRVRRALSFFHPGQAARRSALLAEPNEARRSSELPTARPAAGAASTRPAAAPPPA